MARGGGLFVDTSKAEKATKWSDQVQRSPGRLTPMLPLAALGGPAVTHRRGATSGQFLDAEQVRLQASGAHTDRPRDTFRVAASQQLAAGGAQTHRTTYGGKPLHSPRNRDPGALFGEARAYKAPGSPRYQIEMFYIRHNKKGPKEVRLIARRDRAATFHQSPSLVNAALAQISPRSSFQDVAGGRARELVAVGPVTDWKTGWQKDGSRLAGEGVKWSGRTRKKKGDYGTFTAEAPVPLNSPLADNTSTLWQRGGAQRRKTPPTPDSAVAECMRSPAGSLAESVTLRSPIGNTKWPRQGGSPWKTFVKQVKKRSMTYEDQAEDTFGHAGAGLTQLHQLHRQNQLLTRIPRQWLHTKLTDININACQIQSLPSTFGDYALNVTSLMLEHNLLSSLPDSIAKMSKLRFLGKLPLQLLYHISCQLCTKTLVSVNHCHGIALTSGGPLNISGLTANLFDTFPDVIGKCTALEVLSLQCNKLQAIKASIGYCRELRALYLTNNPLKKLALSIGALQNLSILSYDNTETMTIPPYAVGQVGGHTAVIEWLKTCYHNITVSFRCELRKNFLTPKAAFHHFEVDGDGTLDRNEVARALKLLKVDIKYFEYVWLTLDMDNSGSVDYAEFVQNMTATMDEVLKDPHEALAPYLPQEIIESSVDLLTANPFKQEPPQVSSAQAQGFKRHGSF